MSIPASDIAQINPGVVGSGGSPLSLNGVMLTNDPSVPIGTVQPFPSKDAVAKFYGALSPEAALAANYFAGFDNKTLTPGTLFFAQYPSAPVAAYVRGGSLAGMTLTQLKALTGILTVSIDGTAKTSTAINLTAATSFSNAATIIQAAFTTLGGTVSFDSVRQAFVITSATSGAASSVSAVTGTLAAGLLLGAANGAVLSPGAIAGVPAAAMDAVKSKTLNWVSFMTVFEPVIADKLAFAAWTNAQGKRFAYVAWDSDITATQADNTTSLGPQLAASNSDGTVPIYGTAAHAAFILGAIASIDTARLNGRITFAFRAQSGLVASVTDQTIANNLKENGYNFYGEYATANDGFTFFYPGLVSGEFDFLDEYVNQIWMNNGFQLAFMTMLTQMNSIPYNTPGYATIDAAAMDPINAALNFGAIRTGVPLSTLQINEVNTEAGIAIDTTLSTRGWYLQILPATAQARGTRSSPPMTFWYMDGGSVQQINLASIVVQ